MKSAGNRYSDRTQGDCRAITSRGYKRHGEPLESVDSVNSKRVKMLTEHAEIADVRLNAINFSESSESGVD